MTETKGPKHSAKQKTKSGAAFAATAEEALAAMESASRETIEATSKIGQESLTEAYEKATAYGASSVEKTSEMYETYAAEGKKTLDAMTAATATLIGGMTEANARYIDGLKSGLHFNMSYFEKMSSVEAPQDAAAIQVKAMAEAMDLAAAKSMEIGKVMTEAYAKAYMPMKKRYDESVATLVKSLG